MRVVYFSSASENTHRFVQKLRVDAARIPLRAHDEPLTVQDPYVLIVPTYGGGNTGGAVPKQVIRFLNNPDNRDVFKEAMNAVGEARSTDLKDQPDTFYYGFVYWAAYGGVGVGTLGGRMAAGWDRHGDPALAEAWEKLHAGEARSV